MNGNKGDLVRYQQTDKNQTNITMNTDNDYYPAPDELMDAWINDYDSGMPPETEDLDLDKTESAAQWFDEREKQNAGGAGFSACVHVPASSAPLQLDYPVWRLSFSEYGNAMGWDVPEERVFDAEDVEEWQRRSEEQGAE